MSQRAIQRLRQLELDPVHQKHLEPVHQNPEDESISSQEDDDHDGPNRSSRVFGSWCIDDDDDDEEEEEEKVEEELEAMKEKIKNRMESNVATSTKKPRAKGSKFESVQQNDDDDDWEDMLPAGQNTIVTDDNESNKTEEIQTLPNLLLQGLQPSDFNVHQTLSELLSGVPVDGPPTAKKNRHTNKGLSKTFWFGEPKMDWMRTTNHRTTGLNLHGSARRSGPPTLIGGGLGCTCTSTHPTHSSTTTVIHCTIPWPYNQLHHNTTQPPPQISWYSFLHSDTYNQDLSDFNTHIVASGDIHALALFIADAPFCTQALYQLAMFCFHTHQQQQGLDLLLRIAWIYECAMGPSSRLIPLANPTTLVDNTWRLMNYHSEENKTFFWTLFRLVQTSAMMGCMKTALAVSRFLLSLDPYLDPMGILLVMDSFALGTGDILHLQWLIQMVESNLLLLYHPQQSHPPGHLLDMPNWSFSYALALFRMEEPTRIRSPSTTQRSLVALEQAIQRFPLIPQLLLEKNRVDIQGRSCRYDWPTVLSHLATYNAVQPVDVVPSRSKEYHLILDRMTHIFISRCHMYWSFDEILPWLYDACSHVVQSVPSSQKGSMDHEHSYSSNPYVLTRYLACDPQDFQNSFTMLPEEEAHILDDATLSLALKVDPNYRRGRYFRIQPQGLGNNGGWRRDGTMESDTLSRIDPDLPLLEIFWRSLLPWSRVHGVRP